MTEIKRPGGEMDSTGKEGYSAFDSRVMFIVGLLGPQNEKSIGLDGPTDPIGYNAALGAAREGVVVKWGKPYGSTTVYFWFE